MRAALLFILTIEAIAQPSRFGLPTCSAPNEELIHHAAFTVCYDSLRKVPRWTAYELNTELLTHTATRIRTFRPDPLVTGPSALDSDYRHSGYVRGHMVPAADVSYQDDAMRESFFFSNAVPQNPALNSGKWRSLETAMRRIATSAENMIVITGPIFCGDNEAKYIGEGNVAVPCQLFKVALASRADGLVMFAAILPNDHNPTEPLRTFVTSVAAVEQATGLDFFDALPSTIQTVLESSPSPLN